MWLSLCLFFSAYVAACVVIHKFVLHTGKPVIVSYPFPGGQEMKFTALAGDLGTPLVVREVLQDEVYFKHGVDITQGHATDHSAPLVVDLGCNIGLFALAVSRRHRGAIVVGAEPVRQLWELAVANTAHLSPCVVVVPVGVGHADQDNVPFTFDPHLSAGASMYAAAISQPMWRRPWHAQLSAVLHDNAEAGTLPCAPVMWLCRGLAQNGVRWVVILGILPVLALLFVFLLVGGNHRRVVRGTITTLGGALRRAEQAAESPAVAARTAGTGPIDLLKVDVEGAEMDVLVGITAQEWARIEQVVVEVHDLDGRVGCVCDLLRRVGFDHIAVDTEGWASHELLCLHSVYARRIRGRTAVSVETS